MSVTTASAERGPTSALLLTAATSARPGAHGRVAIASADNYGQPCDARHQDIIGHLLRADSQPIHPKATRSSRTATRLHGGLPSAITQPYHATLQLFTIGHIETIESTMERLSLEETVRFWQPRYSRPLTPEDARQIVENMTGFFSVLQRWSAAANSRQSQPQADKEAAA